MVARAPSRRRPGAVHRATPPPDPVGSLEPTRAWARGAAGRAARRRRDGPPRRASARAPSPAASARRPGTTPLQWLLAQRVLEARRLLEETDLPVEAIAWRAGFGTAASLREHFRRATATTPSAYRRAFTPAPGAR